MKHRGKLLVQHTAIELPNEFVEKYKEDYYIGKGVQGTDLENTYFVNISSKRESKNHSEILLDLMDLLQNETYNIYAVILWDDGSIDRINLVKAEEETFNLVS